MTNLQALQERIKESGMTITFIANHSGIERTTLHNRFRGIGEFTASEIVGLSKVLNLTRKERDDIFFAK